jgi:cystathionine gamma-synthase
VRIALASQVELPDWEVDDAPLHTALLKRGVTVSAPAWTDAAVDWGAFDAVLLRTTWDYAGQRERFVRWADAVGAHTSLHNPAALIRWNTDKRYLRDLAAGGVPTVDTVWLEPGDRPDIARILTDRGWQRAFLKPVFGQTARETLRFDRGEVALAEAHVARLLPDEPLMLQPYLHTVETAGERSAIVIDGHLTHAVVKRAQPGDYRVQDDFGGTDAPTELTAAEHDLVRRVLAVVDAVPLYARLDFLVDTDGQPRLIELEAVEPSLFFRHGRHAADRLAEALLRRVPPPASSRRTLAVRSRGHDPVTGAVVPPLHLATTFARSTRSAPEPWLYSRTDNPTRAQLEAALAALEGGETAIAFASGSAATDAVLRTLRSGDRVLYGDDLYLGTRAQLVGLAEFGVDALPVNLSDPAAVAGAAGSTTRMLWVETPSNPLLRIADIAALRAAVGLDVLLVVDGTWATPALQQPLALGADIVVHSTTKGLAGHSDVTGGAVVGGHHPVLDRVRAIQQGAGAVPSPFDCWLVLRGLPTLHLRVEAACRTARAVAVALAAHPGVRAVHWPGLADHPGHAVAARQMSDFGSMLSFEVADARAALQVAGRLRTFTHATSLGGVESLVEHRASLPGSVAPAGLLRMSIGLEDPADLIADLMAALSARTA